MRRNPHRLSDYVATHEAVMAHLRAEGFVGDDTLAWSRDAHAVQVAGEIACLGEIVVTVNKTLEIIDGEGHNARVLGVEYAYNIHLRNGCDIFRYDNLHPHPGHADSYHKHTYDPFGEPAAVVTWVGQDNWPTLGDVIQEARRWRDAHVDRLENPDVFPDLGVRGR